MNSRLVPQAPILELHSLLQKNMRQVEKIVTWDRNLKASCWTRFIHLCSKLDAQQTISSKNATKIMKCHMKGSEWYLQGFKVLFSINIMVAKLQWLTGRILMADTWNIARKSSDVEAALVGCTDMTFSLRKPVRKALFTGYRIHYCRFTVRFFLTTVQAGQRNVLVVFVESNTYWAAFLCSLNKVFLRTMLSSHLRSCHLPPTDRYAI